MNPREKHVIYLEICMRIFILGNKINNKNKTKPNNSREMTAEDFFFTFCLHMCIFFINVFSNVSKTEMQKKILFPYDCHAM